ncbi:ATP-dependent nuclease subunit B [Bacillus anthracis str. UR-1]|nr:ATP-dependent nuclease subunit B [Bacillus anthracis str. UR-1]
MSLRFVIGRAGSGKSTLCLHEVQEELKQRQEGKQYYILCQNR